MIYYENLKNTNSEFFPDFIKGFSDFLNSGKYVLGQNVDAFEKEFATYLQAPLSVGVGSGLAALELSIQACNFPPKSEIIVPSNTYVASILAILNTGHIPILVEPDITTYNIDPSKITEKITPKTKAVLVVHMYGKSSDMGPIEDICRLHNLVLIEDCAQSHGAKYKNKFTGTFGIGAFSFYPTKNLGALGEAGAVVTSDLALDLAIRKLRNYGSTVQYQNDLIGTNQRLDELQAVLLRIKLTKLDAINLHKRQLAKIYQDNLSDKFIKPVVRPDFYDVYHIYNIRHPRRDQLRQYLLDHEIQTAIHYPTPPHKQPALSDLFRGQSFPLSEEIHATTLSLPISYSHTNEDIARVVEVMNKFN